MTEEINDFIEALSRPVEKELQRNDAVYNTDAVQIVDARNHIFRILENTATDESADIYALSDLCVLSDDMTALPNYRRLRRIAGNYWSL